ncbi:MAG TPA: ferrochelatase [Candidatus Corynebacterium avicola]|uniref:Coproporphyrin III ferrochelatase n=1 Tax=Candidatus Corynebacterium avicola TaxID=2838527 RepID=A0A9D1UM93_9CORY|nr:ferrochelatase [Candidatus Corynebacterium avicola]
MLLSFGGPEKADDVVPFLENVTRGRGIPRERLEVVGEHYFALGGRSPLNDLNREMITAIRGALERRGVDIPVYFGNRNWHPFIEDTVEAMARDGVRHTAVFATSAWGGYSGCRQYHEDIARARQAVAERGSVPPRMTRLRQFHDHPRFIAEFADAVDAARADLPTLRDADDAELIFTAHSVPLTADGEAGPPGVGGHLYSRQVHDSARLILQASSFGAGADAGAGAAAEPTVVWQSRSGPPSIPWLDPDICDHLEARAASGNTRPVILCPVGFVSDHVEVLWDLDTEARDTARSLGVELVRAATPGATAGFADMVVDLMKDAADAAGVGNSAGIGEMPNFGNTENGSLCALHCCGS